MSAIQGSLPPPQRPATDAALVRFMTAAGVVPGQPMSPAKANSVRLAVVMCRISEVLSGGVVSDQLGQLCGYLSRGIDYALGINDVPQQAQLLPFLVKQIYMQKYDTSLQVKAAITMLLISVKNAAKRGWFRTTETTELLNLANESCSSFCMTANDTADMNYALETIIKIIPRFYPKLKLCGLIASFEVKTGYNCLMGDFDIQRSRPSDEKILLFVAQTDNIETSSCLRTPPNASFLINGRGVERRTNVSLDIGPQFPSDITNMLLYGSNSIQAIGYFTGNFIIAITSMGKAAPTATLLGDYVHPAVTALDPDSEIVEGVTEVSLKCPLSLKRIKIPVKGHLCKHHQCFDYDNFMEMNSRKPIWRCSCCDQSVSCIDLRIDQRMVKILSETGVDTSNVLISPDGSWKAVEKKCESKKSSRALGNLIDLTTEGDNECAGKADTLVEHVGCSTSQILSSSCEVEDRKPFIRDQVLTNSSATVAQVDPSRTLDDTFPRTWLPTSASNIPQVSTVSRDAHRDGSLQSVILNCLLNAQATNSTTAPFDQASLEFSQSTLPLRNASRNMQLSENLQLRHPCRGSSVTISETERPPLPRLVNRTNVAVQPLAAQVQTSNLSEGRCTNALNYGSGFLNQDGFIRASTSVGMQQDSRNLGRILMTQQTPDRGLDQQDGQCIEFQPADCNRTRALSDHQRHTGAYRAGLCPPFDQQNSYRQLLSLQARLSSTFQQYHTPPMHTSQNAATVTVQNYSNEPGHSCSSQHAEQAMGLQLPDEVRAGHSWMAPGRMSSSLTEQAMGLQLPDEVRAGHSWMASGRMRGSLTGSAYAAALDRYQAQAAQPAHARPPF